MSDDDVRKETGYGGRARPREEPRGEWVMRWEPRTPEPAAPPASVKVCNDCRSEVAMLHPMGDDPRRLWCAACQGRYNRARVEAERAKKMGG